MLWWFTQNALIALLLAVIVAALCRFLKPAPAFMHGLWLVVLIKLLAPPMLSWPWALPVFVHSQEENDSLLVLAAQTEESQATTQGRSDWKIDFKELAVALEPEDADVVPALAELI